MRLSSAPAGKCFRISAIELFSQPRPSTSTPPTFGWQIRSARI